MKITAYNIKTGKVDTITEDEAAKILRDCYGPAAAAMLELIKDGGNIGARELILRASKKP